MPTNKRPRKPYRQSGAGHIVLPEQHRDMLLPLLGALTAFQHGHGTDGHRHTLAYGINIAGSVAVNVHGGDKILPFIEKAKDSLISMDCRFVRVGKWGMSAAELSAIRKAVLMCSQLLRRSNTSTVAQAIAHIYAINANREQGLGSVECPIEMPNANS